MIRSIVGACVLVFGIALAGLPAAADETSDDAAKPASSIVAVFSGLPSAGKAAAQTPWRTVPVAACSAECCCQIYDGGKMVYQCKSQNDCINEGGLCKSKTDAQCK
jgi:hypothetical protein